MRYILSFDEGTTSARAALYDGQGQRVGMAQAPFDSRYPQSGWVEQDPESIWLSQLNSGRTLLAERKVDAKDIAALGITNQRETTIVWERATARPVAPAIVWQCRRTAEACAQLVRDGHGDAITAKTGLVVDAYFSASKIRWLLDAIPDGQKRAENGELLFGNVDTWLIWRLTNGAAHVTDLTNASRTMLMDIETGEWDEGMLRLFGIPRVMLPRIVSSSEVVGESAPEHLGAPIPIAGIAGDQQAALAGQACFRPGLSKNTYGTGCFALLHTGGKRPVSRNKLLATRAASFPGAGQYAIEGSVFVAGAVVKWLRDQMGLITTAAESESLASTVTNTGGVYLVPAFVGLGAPWWDGEARATVSGMSFGTGRAHLVRAALESIAYQTRDLIGAMESDTGQKLTELRVDGGATANNLLMQFQADILGVPIVRPVDIETTALGAAYLAGLAVGYWKSTEDVERFWRAERTFEPKMDAGRREELYAGWQAALRRTRTVG